jgi:hypothetical protein
MISTPVFKDKLMTLYGKSMQPFSDICHLKRKFRYIRLNLSNPLVDIT